MPKVHGTARKLDLHELVDVVGRGPSGVDLLVAHEIGAVAEGRDLALCRVLDLRRLVEGVVEELLRTAVRQVAVLIVGKGRAAATDQVDLGEDVGAGGVVVVQGGVVAFLTGNCRTHRTCS